MFAAERCFRLAQNIRGPLETSAPPHANGGLVGGHVTIPHGKWMVVKAYPSLAALTSANSTLNHRAKKLPPVLWPSPICYAGYIREARTHHCSACGGYRHHQCGRIRRRLCDAAFPEGGRDERA